MKLLIVEDEIRMVKLLQRGLAEEGHEVTCAVDGFEALREANSAQYDVIILDIMMPRLDGYEVTESLRLSKNMTPVLMLTAKDSVPDIVQGLDLGADDYLTKPFSFQELLARLRAVERRVAAAGRRILRVADLALDLDRREVSRAEARVWLTRREYALLEALMRHRGQVVPRQTLIEEVWGCEIVIEENTLDAFMRLLRHKVDPPGRTKLIHTVRGTGYVLQAETTG